MHAALSLSLSVVARGTSPLSDVYPPLDSPQFAAWETTQVRAAQSGDRAALAALYDVYAAPLYQRVLLPRLGDARAAEDALSETFHSALTQLHRFELREAGFWPWLARIATNKALDMHRQRARGGRALANFAELCLRESDATRVGSPAERTRELADLARQVREVLDGLTPRYRTAIELRFFEERSREQCAEALDVKLGTFDVLLLRALRSFREAWQALRQRESRP